MAEFDERKHPRKKDGKFAPKGNGENRVKELESKYNDDLPLALKAETFKVKPKNIFKTDSKQFFNNMAKAKELTPPENRWRVDTHEESDYKNDKLFTTDGGSCVAIEPSGNIVSVCRNLNDKSVRGKDLLEIAVKNGGDRLDAFGGLYDFYTKQGFEPISWVEFDENYKPDGWRKGVDKPEPVIFYKYTGKQTETSYEDFIKNVAPSKDYDSAQEIRDRSIKK